jgi:hypothetical protein
VTTSATGLIALWLWAEVVDRRASARWLGHGTGGSSSARRIHAVVVLGFGNSGERANLVNRFRVRAGVRSLDPRAESLLVLCGGPVHGPVPEAVLMRRYACERLGYIGPVALDTTSRSTRENIAHAIPFLERADTIAIVSNAPHAEMGRQILWDRRPDLAVRLVRGADHRFGEAPVLKILGALRATFAKRTALWVQSSQGIRTGTPPPRP